jgi:methionyl-tRNA formyltransferase
LKIVIITQDEPFYLADAISHLLNFVAGKHDVCACVLLAPSPFGKKESMAAKALRTLKIFGPTFFLRYASMFAIGRLVGRARVASVLRRAGVPVVRLDRSINHGSSISRIKSFAPDALVSVAGNEIFRKELIDLAPQGCLNLHSALLPKYRGLFPSFWVLKNQETDTGVSVFLVDEEIDNGPILVQKRIAVGKRTLEALIRESKNLGMQAIAEALDKLEAGDRQLIPNDRAHMTYFGFPTRADVKEFLAAGRRFF